MLFSYIMASAVLQIFILLALWIIFMVVQMKPININNKPLWIWLIILLSGALFAYNVYLITLTGDKSDTGIWFTFHLMIYSHAFMWWEDVCNISNKVNKCIMRLINEVRGK